VRVELLLAPDCPHAADARAVLARCLDQLGLDEVVAERVGDYPSPTVLVEGVDVMSGTARDATGAPELRACRLDVPTAPRILAALQGRRGRPGAPSDPAGK
jgi:hypothetical protein